MDNSGRSSMIYLVRCCRSW